SSGRWPGRGGHKPSRVMQEYSWGGPGGPQSGRAVRPCRAAPGWVCREIPDVLPPRHTPAALPLTRARDISLKNGNGIDLIRRIRARADAVRILVWSMYPENLYAERALRAGAQGYLHKGRATRQLLDAIRAVLAGKVYVSGELADELLRRVVGGRAAERSPIDRLSDRELEAFGLMGHGLTTEAIAGKMHVSPKTVETYRARIKEKLGVSHVTELIQRAAQWVLENP